MSNNKLIIVDDEEIILNQFNSFLARKGYSVFTASCGEDALVLLKEQDADLMILDLHLKEGLQGADVLKQALRLKPGLKVAMHTGVGQDKNAVQMCLDMGAKTILPKPIALSVLKEEIEKLKNL